MNKKDFDLKHENKKDSMTIHINEESLDLKHKRY